MKLRNVAEGRVEEYVPSKVPFWYKKMLWTKPVKHKTANIPFTNPTLKLKMKENHWESSIHIVWNVLYWCQKCLQNMQLNDNWQILDKTYLIEKEIQLLHF
jgi:hypothetical protein